MCRYVCWTHLLAPGQVYSGPRFAELFQDVRVRISSPPWLHSHTHNWTVMLRNPRMGYHIIMVEGFVCPNDPGSSVVWIFMSPGRATHGKQVLCEGPGKV